MSNTGVLPNRVSRIQVEGKDVYLVGTAHVSKESVEDVRTTVEQVRPDAVCVELCAGRHKALTQRDNWQKMDIFKVIRDKKATLLLAQLVMSSFYRQLGEKLGVQPGAEMLAGIDEAEKTGAQLVLADRDVQITLKRVWRYLGFWNKLKLAMHLTLSIFTKEEISADLVESLKQKDQLEAIMAEFTEKFPEIKKRLIDERDIYLAQKIRTAPGKKIVAVVGAGHVPGIQQQIQQDHDLAELEKVPPKSRWSAVVGWGIPLFILALLVYGFFAKGAAYSVENIYIWIGVTGILSAVGAAAALAHPLTILSAFMAAPVTTLHPAIAAGWVAGLVQAWVKRPTVRDLEDLPNAISSLKGFWTNPATRILLIIALSNLGSAAGAYIGAAWIGARMLGAQTPPS